MSKVVATEITASAEYAPIEGSRFVMCQIGFACFITVMGRSLRDISSLFAWAGLDTLGVMVVPNAVHIAALFGIACLCSSRHIPRLGLRSYIYATLAFVAAYASVLVSMEVGFPSAAATVCGILSGLASALGMTVWVCVFYEEGNRATPEVIAGSILSCVIGMATDGISEFRITLFVCMALSVVSLCCMAELFSHKLEVARDIPENGQGQHASARLSPAWLTPAQPALAQPVQTKLIPTLKATLGLVWFPALCIGTLGFASAAARGMVGVHDVDSMVQITMASELVAGFVLLLTYLHGWLRSGLSSLYKLLFPVGAVSFLVLTFAGGSFVAMLAAIAEFSFMLCSMLMTPQAIDLCKKNDLPPTVLYGVFSALTHTVLALGYLLVPMSGDGTNDAVYPVIAVIAIFVLAMVMGLIPRHPQEPMGILYDTLGATQHADAEGEVPTGRQVAGTEVTFPDELAGIELSSREEEILALILRGRDIPFISEALCISKNTVRTHVKRLYAKFDVHSRQELIDLFSRD